MPSKLPLWCMRPGRISIATGRISTRSWARRVRAISASMRCISISKDLLDSAWRRRTRRWSGGPFIAACGFRAGAVPAPEGGRLASRRASWRGARRIWPDRRVPWPDGHVRARLCLYAVAWCRRLAQGRRGRRAECELYPREPQGSHVRAFRRQALHARSFVRRDMADAHWPYNPRFCQGDDRRRLSPDDDLFSPRGAWRDVDRADRIGIESLARSFHRGLARSRAGRKARGHRAFCRRASSCAPPPPRRNPRGPTPHSEMDEARGVKGGILRIFTLGTFT